MQNSSLVRCGVTTFFLNLALWGSSPIAQAQIITDGTMGPGSVLSGPHYQIPAELGRKLGPNLFHSFLDFQLNSGESATFSGPASIRNILSRVTSGNPSILDGQLNSTIGGANFFFINPAGVVFGPNAQVNVGGSFVVSSADVVKLGQTGSFNALIPSATILTSAPPQAFGFLTPNPQPIQFYGSQIEGAPGRSISIIGGGIGVYDGSTLQSSGGLNLVSVGSVGEIRLDASNNSKPIEANNFTAFGAIEVTGGSLLLDNGSAGIGIYGQNLLMADSAIASFRDSSKPNSPATMATIHIEVAGPVEMGSGSLIQSLTNNTSPGAKIEILADRVIMGADTQIEAITQGKGRGGDITLDAGKLQMADAAGINTSTQGPGHGGDVRVTVDELQATGKNSPTGIFAVVQGSGDGGNLNVEANKIDLYRAALSTNNLGTGAGGNLTIKADTLVIDGGESNFAGIGSDAHSTGVGGAVSITVRELQSRNGASISTSTVGQGKGGSIEIFADSILLEGNKVGTAIQAATGAQGDGGAIKIQTGKLQVLGNASVLASTLGAGKGGFIEITADHIVLDGRNVILDPTDPLAASGLVAESRAPESDIGGSISVTTQDLQMRRGAVISTGTYSTKRGGDIVIEAKNINIDGRERSTGINAGTAGSGNSGSINIEADSLQLLGKGVITTSTVDAGNGGSINILARDILLDGANSNEIKGITSVSQETASGNSGDIFISTDQLRIIGRIGIDNSTASPGNSGSITINAKKILLDGQGTGASGISASAVTKDGDSSERLGSSGKIDIVADDLQILGDASIASVNAGPKASNQINIVAKNILIDGQNLADARNIASDTAGLTESATGGAIFIDADNFKMQNGALVSSNTLGAGAGGNIIVDAKNATLESGSFITGITFGAGKGGNIEVKADSLTVNGKGKQTGFSADTAYTGAQNVDKNLGNGGEIKLNVSGQLLMTDSAYASTSTVNVDGETATGNAGAINISAGDMMLDRSLIASIATGSGNGGRVKVDAITGSILLNRGQISAKALQAEAGNIELTSHNSVGLGNGSTIDTEATNGNGGNIKILTGRSFRSQRSVLSSFAKGKGGDITVDSLDKSTLSHDILLDRSIVSANAIDISGGNIKLRSRIFLPSAESRVTATATIGINGTVDIQSPNTNVGGSLINLPSNLLGAENYLAERCVVRSTGASSSFTVEPQNGAPSRPGDLLPSPAPR